MIESLGVPHPEIEAITVNSVPVDFDYLMQDDNRVDVYPTPLDVPNAIALRFAPILTCHHARDPFPEPGETLTHSSKQVC